MLESYPHNYARHESLADKLSSLEPQEDRLDYLGRLASLAADNFREFIPPIDLAKLSKPLPDWMFSQDLRRKEDGSTYVLAIAERDMPDGLSLPDHQAYDTPRHRTGIRNSYITVLVRTAFKGEDLAAIFKLEQDLIKAGASKPNNAGNKTRELELDLDAREFVYNLANTAPEIAWKLGIDNQEVAEWFKYIVRHNEMTPEKFLSVALQSNLIELNSLPRVPNIITRNDLDVMATIFMNLESAREIVGCSSKELSLRRDEIKKILGVSESWQVYIMYARLVHSRARSRRQS